MKDKRQWLRISQFVLLVTLVLFGFSLMYAQIIFVNYRLIAYVLVLLIVGLVTRYIKRKSINIVLSVVLILGSAGSIYAQSLVNQIGDDKTNVDVVDFVVLRSSDIQSIEDTTFAQFERTTLVSNQVISEAENHLKSVLSFIPTISVVSTYDELVQDLYDKRVDIIILNESYKSHIIDEIDPDYESKIRVIATITINVDEEDTSKPVSDVTNTPFIIYISGNDNTGQLLSSARSDVNMLIVIDPNTHRVLMISIPRDTYTYSPCYGYKDKLTHTGNSGVNCTTEAVEKLFGVEINYYLRLNFTSFINIVDIIGEITVYSKEAFTTTGGAYSFIEGDNIITSGNEALAFVRERYNLSDGDVGRAIHQQEVLKGLINALISPSSIMKIGTITNQISASIDTNFGSSNITKIIAAQQNGNPNWTFETDGLIGEYGNDYVSGYSTPKSVYYPDETSVQTIADKIKTFMGN